MAAPRRSKRVKLSHPEHGKAGATSLPTIISSLAPTSSSAPTNKFDTFTCFPRLPPELRVIIWCMTPEPRMIKAFADREEGGALVKGKYAKYAFRSKIPAGLHVSQESRAELLKIYRLYMSTERMLRHTIGVYVNPQIDTIFFNRHGPDLYLFDRNQTSQIKSIALDGGFWSKGDRLGVSRRPWISQPRVPLELFPNVEDITFIIHKRSKCPKRRFECAAPVTWTSKNLATKLLSLKTVPDTTHPLVNVHKKLCRAKVHWINCDGLLLTQEEIDRPEEYFFWYTPSLHSLH